MSRAASNPGRTTCRFCESPLTRGQMRRGNEHCSRRCVKLRDHRRDPALAKRAGALSWAKVGRPRYVQRLAETLRCCATKAEAYRLGYTNGYKIGVAKARRQEGRAA